MKPARGLAPSGSAGWFARLTGSADGASALSKRQWTRLTGAHQVRAIRTHRWAVIVVTVLGAAGAAAFTATQTPVYQSTVQFVFTPNYPAKDLEAMGRGSNYVLQRINTYSTIANNEDVAATVVERLGLPYTSEQVMENVIVATHAGSTAVEIHVRDSSAARAHDIANAYGEEFPRFVGRLETPDQVGTSPIRVSLVRAATVPSAPISPNPVNNIGLGLLGGLACGLVFATVRYAQERSVRDEQHATEITDLSLLGVADAVLLDAGRVAAPAAEAFRQMRTNVKLRAAGQRLTSLTVVGSVPGEDTGMVAANLALTWARAGETVVLIDADFTGPSVAELFATPGAVGLAEVLSGQATAAQAVQQWQPNLPLFLLPAGTPEPGGSERLLRSNELAKLMEAFRRSNMFVVLLAPPLLANADALVLVSATDAVVATTRVRYTHADRLAAALQVLQQIRASVLGIVTHAPGAVIPHRALPC